MKFILLCLLTCAGLTGVCEATQIKGAYQCAEWGGWDTAASLAVDIPPASYECTTAYTQDQGWMAIGPAGVWQKLSTLQPVAISTPNSRSLTLATAFQATDTTRPALVNVNLTSTATLSLSGGTTNTAQVVIGSTNAVAAGTGTIICQYSNSNTGTLTVGLGLSTISAVPCSFTLPAGWFMAVRQIAGTVSISSAFDQSLG